VALGQAEPMRINNRLITKRRVVPAGSYIPSEDSIDIILTDINLHAQKPSKPSSLVRNMAKQLKSGKPRRSYSHIRPVADNTYEVGINFNEQEVIELLAKNKKRMLRVYVPTTGLPVHMAEDALEKLESLKRQHLLQST